MCLLVDYELHLIHLYILYCVPFSSACLLFHLAVPPVSWPVSGTQCDVKKAAVEVEVSADTAGREAEGHWGTFAVPHCLH